jgi:LmbE family N-acetylglucosaminyl deacetylase
MYLIYLSPHLDDAIYSCGGIIYSQIQIGDRVEIWSLFTSDPPKHGLTQFALELHSRWGGESNPYQIRRNEDQEACGCVGAGWRHLNYPDCIYRHYPETGQAVILSAQDLSKPGKPFESKLSETITAQLKKEIPPDSIIIAPMGVGNHVDHILVKEVANKLPNLTFYYSDFPYSGKISLTSELSIPAGALSRKFEVPPAAMEKWKQAANCYQSQLSSFWKSSEDLERALDSYSGSKISNTLWSW